MGAKTESVPVNEIPLLAWRSGPTPFKKGGYFMGQSNLQTSHLPPLPKGDPPVKFHLWAEPAKQGFKTVEGGFCCALVLPKISAVYLLYEQS